MMSSMAKLNTKGPATALFLLPLPLQTVLYILLVFELQQLFADLCHQAAVLVRFAHDCGVLYAYNYWATMKSVTLLFVLLLTVMHLSLSISHDRSIYEALLKNMEQELAERELLRIISRRERAIVAESEPRERSNGKEYPDSGGKPGTVAPGITGLQESCRLPKRKKTRMAICTYNARTLALEAAIEDLTMLAKKIYRGAGGVGIHVNTSMAKNSDSFEQLTTRIGHAHDYLRRLRSNIKPQRRRRSRSSLYGPGEVLQRSCLSDQDHVFYKVIIGDFNAKIGPRRTPEELHIGTHGLQWNDQGERLSEFIMTTKTIHGNSQFRKSSSLRWTWKSPGGGYRNEIDHIIVSKSFCLTDVAVVPKFYTGSDHRLLRGRFFFTRKAEKTAMFRERNSRTIINWDLFGTLAGFWEDSAMDNIDKEYDRLVEHLHDCAKKAENFKTTKRRLSLETLELIRQRGAARAAGNQELTFELARLCREAIKEDLKERRAEVLAEAAEAGKSISYAHRDFASRKTRMTALRNLKETATASRRGMEKIIYDFYSDLFDSHVHLRPHHLRKTDKSFQKFSRPKYDMLSCRIEKVLDEGQPCKQAGFRIGFSTIDHIHTVPKLIEVSLEYKMPLCLTFIDLKKAFDSVETEVVVEALDNQGVPTQCIKVLRELYSNFTTGMSPFYKNIITHLSLQMTMFMRNGWVSDAPFTLNGTNISECTSYVYLGRELNMMNDLTPELGRRRRAAWGAYKNIEDVVKKTRNTRLRAHLFNTTVLPALTYASET
ncbi:hypothetical protein RB195_025436 [Necator americanus]|uniref:Endonuclease/exonuclease/phosphatase domain-containing protein n=1 Tax=Necator americanus TaxID=51031 RepID=A0ABR1EUG0_NECAM